MQILIAYRGEGYRVDVEPGQSALIAEVMETVDVTVTGMNPFALGIGANGIVEATRVDDPDGMQISAYHITDQFDHVVLAEVPPGNWDVVYRQRDVFKDVLARGRFTCDQSGPISVHLRPVVPATAPDTPEPARR